jgi:hypothetical protein
VAPRGRRVRIRFAKRVAGAVTVGIFQAAAGRRVVGNRRVARFTGRQRSFTWNGRSTTGRRVRDGVLFARVRVRVARGVTDVRRVTLRRRNGRFSVAPSFYRRRSCGLLAQFKLSAPAFGGRTRKRLGIAFRLSRTANVSLRVSRGGRVVKRFRTTRRRAHKTYRLRLRPAGLARGRYRVRLTVHAGPGTVRSTLTSRRL